MPVILTDEEQGTRFAEEVLNSNDSKLKTWFTNLLNDVLDFLKKIYDALSKHQDWAQMELVRKDKAAVQMIADAFFEGLKGTKRNAATQSREKSDRSNFHAKASESKYQIKGTDEYTDAEISVIKRDKRNIIATSENDIEQFIKTHIERRGEYKRLFCGKLTSKFIERVLKDTGYDLAGASYVIDSNYENSHSDPAREMTRGQTAITPKIIAKLPSALDSYASVEYQGTAADGRDAFKFFVEINGKKVAIEYYSASRRSFTLYTMYGWAPENKKSPSATSDANAPDTTSETTASLGSDSIIPDSSAPVKNSLRTTPEQDAAYMDAVESEDTETAQRMWADALADASKAHGTTSETATSESQDIRYSPLIARDDVISIQSIDRKSINDFTPEDVRRTGPFARQYLKEMGVKSPFFRAWFGDWRANDQRTVMVANQQGSARGVQKNADTGWDINVSGRVFNETRSQNSVSVRSAQRYLPYINDIVKKAILLDSFTMSAAKSPNSLMMHSLYTVADFGDGPEVLKLYVEEMNDPNQSVTAKRAYQLQNVERQQPGAKGSGRAPSLVTRTADIRTVSDLHSIVKQYDKSFKPKPVNKALLNTDGTPKLLYHGTDYTFTVFKARDNNSEFFFTDDINAARDYGEKQMPVYLKMSNPYEMDLQGEGDAAIYDALDYAHENGYDGVIARNAYDGANTHTEYVVFSPTQVKSATDNIGTFDGTNPDIRFSLRVTPEQDAAYMDAVESGDTETAQKMWADACYCMLMRIKKEPMLG